MFGIDDAILIPAAVSLFSGILGSQGQKEANETNRYIAEQNSAFNAQQAWLNRNFQSEQVDKQMAFQERMSGTSYQRATQDMMAAGLNPMLAYSQGGASTPGGAAAAGSAASAAQPPAMLNRAAAGLNAAAQAAQIANTQQDTHRKEAETREIESRIPEAESRIKEREAITRLSDNELKERMETFEKRFETLRYTTKKAEGERELPFYDIARGEREKQRDYPQQREQLARTHESGARANTLIEEAKILRSEAAIRGLKIPAAVNEAAMETGGFGGVRPYIRPVSEGVGTVLRTIGTRGKR